MEDMEKNINCEIHGSAQPAYVCQHLLTNPAQHWFSDLASAKNRCPDAWCRECETHFQAHTGWTDDSATLNNIKLVCQFCYEGMRSKSVSYCMGEVDDTWKPFVARCVGKLKMKQSALRDQFKIDEHKRWDWDQDLGTLIFSNDGMPAVRAEFQFVGSIAEQSKTWLWAWANDSLNPRTYEAIKQLQEYGDKSKYENMIVPLWDANEIDGWEMAAVAVEVLNAKGVYRTPNQHGCTYLAITNIDWIA